MGHESKEEKHKRRARQPKYRIKRELRKMEFVKQESEISDVLQPSTSPIEISDNIEQSSAIVFSNGHLAVLYRKLYQNDDSSMSVTLFDQDNQIIKTVECARERLPMSVTSPSISCYGERALMTWLISFKNGLYQLIGQIIDKNGRLLTNQAELVPIYNKDHVKSRISAILANGKIVVFFPGSSLTSHKMMGRIFSGNLVLESEVNTGFLYNYNIAPIIIAYQDGFTLFHAIDIAGGKSRLFRQRYNLRGSIINGPQAAGKLQIELDSPINYNAVKSSEDGEIALIYQQGAAIELIISDQQAAISSNVTNIANWFILSSASLVQNNLLTLFKSPDNDQHGRMIDLAANNNFIGPQFGVYNNISQIIDRFDDDILLIEGVGAIQNAVINYGSLGQSSSISYSPEPSPTHITTPSSTAVPTPQLPSQIPSQTPSQIPLQTPSQIPSTSVTARPPDHYYRDLSLGFGGSAIFLMFVVCCMVRYCKKNILIRSCLNLFSGFNRFQDEDNIEENGWKRRGTVNEDTEIDKNAETGQRSSNPTSLEAIRTVNSLLGYVHQPENQVEYNKQYLIGKIREIISQISLELEEIGKIIPVTKSAIETKKNALLEKIEGLGGDKNTEQNLESKTKSPKARRFRPLKFLKSLVGRHKKIIINASGDREFVDDLENMSNDDQLNHLYTRMLWQLGYEEGLADGYEELPILRILTIKEILKIIAEELEKNDNITSQSDHKRKVKKYNNYTDEIISLLYKKGRISDNRGAPPKSIKDVVSNEIRINLDRSQQDLYKALYDQLEVFSTCLKSDLVQLHHRITQTIEQIKAITEPASSRIEARNVVSEASSSRAIT